MNILAIDRTAAQDATPTGNFSGQVWMQRLIGEQQSTEIEMLVVFFEAGGRTLPHVHPVDQILHIVDGHGIVATASERHQVEAGKVIVIPAGEWHWHGATPRQAMTHISIKQYGATDWTVDTCDWDDYT